MNALLTITCLLSTPAAALSTQAPQLQKARTAPVAKAKKDATEIKVFALKQAEANAAAKTIAGLGFNKVMVAVDARTNSLIATGTIEDLALIEAVLLRLDEADPKEDTSDQLTVFPLRANATEVEKTMRVLVPRDVRTVVDANTNSLIVSASPGSLARIKELLRVLDSPPAKPITKSLKLRVVWLMTNADGTAPTDDLKPVVQSLERIGIKNLTVVTQSLVNVSEERSQFDVAGTVGEEERTFRISGHRDVRNGKPIRLDMAIEAQPKGQKRAAMIEAAVTLEPGQTAVLGVTQTKTANSAFVVQLIEGM